MVRFVLTRADLQRWLRPGKDFPMQSLFASFEALAQLILLVLRRREFVRQRSCVSCAPNTAVWQFWRRRRLLSHAEYEGAFVLDLTGPGVLVCAFRG